MKITVLHTLSFGLLALMTACDQQAPTNKPSTLAPYKNNANGTGGTGVPTPWPSPKPAGTPYVPPVATKTPVPGASPTPVVTPVVTPAVVPTLSTQNVNTTPVLLTSTRATGVMDATSGIICWFSAGDPLYVSKADADRFDKATDKVVTITVVGDSVQSCPISDTAFLVNGVIVVAHFKH